MCKNKSIQTQFVINNPNAQSACGCGVSVNFNDNIEEIEVFFPSNKLKNISPESC